MPFIMWAGVIIFGLLVIVCGILTMIAFSESAIGTGATAGVLLIIFMILFVSILEPWVTQNITSDYGSGQIRLQGVRYVTNIDNTFVFRTKNGKYIVTNFNMFGTVRDNKKEGPKIIREYASPDEMEKDLDNSELKPILIYLLTNQKDLEEKAMKLGILKVYQ